MKFQDLALLAAQTIRLSAASAAIKTAEGSFTEEAQVFGYAGQQFTGSDANCLKLALMNALGEIADDARHQLEAAGIEFDPPPAVAVEAQAAAA